MFSRKICAPAIYTRAGVKNLSPALQLPETPVQGLPVVSQSPGASRKVASCFAQAHGGAARQASGMWYD
eukprot:scaffold204648_cov30-Cyclotella_meneghiniana.AAC.1